jgi:hypothetical protein
MEICQVDVGASIPHFTVVVSLLPLVEKPDSVTRVLLRWVFFFVVQG